ncbi:ABC transporter substrate-binding protein [Frigidibacter mobilis]|uniref:ABC transporter substrate-binding protein n=1 Tax=Frigidibacter mobilis TaxID=1335048 RepID=A0A159Z760_9RHOB|nr:ABC transporter substrate-binding protein [Frigidibacter mobilis]AMY70334.1 ABC transporter substrate-binding protein [Frigidibacter mobilis]
MKRRAFLTSSMILGAGMVLPAKWAAAQSREDSLRVLSEGAANSFESFSVGINRNSLQISWNIYDRLVKFAYKAREDGTAYYDYFDIQPELAERYEVSDDKTSITFHLRKDAVFHDGAPVTAEDVKWSLDRVVSSPIGLSQFGTGSMKETSQFVVVDAHTVRIDLPQPDRFALPNLALTYPIIVNSKLALQHATTEDPFASEWLKMNPAGGGAYKIARAQIGERILFERFEDWKSGPLPAFRQVLWQTVPAAESRVASLLKGDADVAQDLPPKDVMRLLENTDVKVVGVPTSSFQFIGMNTQLAPFDDVRVRQAIAYALPYDAMFQTALFGRGQPLFGGEPGAPETTTFPQPLGYSTDLEKAKALLAEAGLPDGFETTFQFELSVATVAEPVALLLQESLGKIGIRVTIDKVPAGQLGTLLQEKKVPFYFEGSTSYLADPDYFFRVFYYGDTRWNFGSYQNPEFISLVDATRYETDQAAYDTSVRRMIELVKDEVPIILLWHPSLDTGMAKSVEDYSYTFHRQLDFRPLTRG